MPEPVVTPPVVTPPPPAAPLSPGAPPTPAPVVVAPPPPPAPAPAVDLGVPLEEGGGKNVVLSQSAFKRIRDEAARKAEARLAKESGFASVEEYREAIKAAKAAKASRAPPAPAPARTPAPQTPPPNGQRPNRREAAANEKAAREVEQLRRKMVEESKERRRAQREKEALQAQIQLERSAHAEGVTDPDYAIRLLTRHLAEKNLTEEECSKFDERGFFKGLRTTHPFLFTERVVPANTGPSGAPPPPTPAEVAAAAAGGKFDARKATKQEFDAWLKKQGFKRP